MQNLSNVDLYRYDEAWELDISYAFAKLYGAPEDGIKRHILASSTLTRLLPDVILLDLRSPSDFKAGHLPGAVNLPLESLSASSSSAFQDSMVLEAQWLELESIFSTNNDQSAISPTDHLKGCIVILTCYDGNTARVATSVLHAKDINAYSIRGGMRRVATFLKRDNDNAKPSMPIAPAEVCMMLPLPSNNMHQV